MNRWPADYESAALPTELRRPAMIEPFKSSGFTVQGCLSSMILPVSEFVLAAFRRGTVLSRHFGVNETTAIPCTVRRGGLNFTAGGGDKQGHARALHVDLATGCQVPPWLNNGLDLTLTLNL